MPFEMRHGKLTDNLPLSIASTTFRLKQAVTLLVPGDNPSPEPQRSRLQRARALVIPGRDASGLADELGEMPDQPVLFLSAGRSGTTLLRSMLVAGGDIAIPPESYMLCWATLKFHGNRGLPWPHQTKAILDLIAESPVFHLWDFDVVALQDEAAGLPTSKRNLACLLDLVYRRYAAEHFPRATRWGDQSIENTLQIQWLVRTFPRAKYLHVLRDGRDVASSWVEQGRPVDNAVDMWRIDLEKVGWLRKRLPDECFYEVRYEDLVAEPESTLRPLCDYAEIPYRPAMLDYWRRESTVEHKDDPALHGNLAKPVFTASVGSWRDRLTDQEQEVVLDRLGPLLEPQGYAID